MVVLDLAAPIIVFYGLRCAGAGVLEALIAAAIASTLSMLLNHQGSTRRRAGRQTIPH